MPQLYIQDEEIVYAHSRTIETGGRGGGGPKKNANVKIPANIGRNSGRILV